MKSENPKDAIGRAKVPMFSVMPRDVLAEVVVALAEGAWKYGRHNYRVAPVVAGIYVDAADRHNSAFWEGEDIDPDSDIHHISKAIASLIVLRAAQLNGTWYDDRPPRPKRDWLSRIGAQMTDMIERLQERHPKSKPPYVESERASGGTTCT